MSLSRHQNVEQNNDTKAAHRLFENVGAVQIFWNDSNETKTDSGGN
jgi:hypothetical protein